MTISFVTIFDTSTRKFRILDTTDYAGQGVLLSNVKGVLKLTTPRGVTYDNTNYSSPDVNQFVSLYSGYITLPENASGYILAGAYTIQYSVYNSDDSTTSTDSNSYTYNFIVPAIEITQTVDGYNSTFSSVDSTDYGSYDSLTRTHTVTPPVGSGLPTTSSSNATINYTPNIYSGVWTSVITSTAVYNQVDLLQIVATITGAETVTAYKNDMDTIRGYIEDFQTLYEQARANDRNLAYRYQLGLQNISIAYVQYKEALYYNDLTEAYNKTVEIFSELNDVVTITFPEEITPFVNSTGGSGHNPVSIASGYYGVSINTNQVLSFSIATNERAGMIPPFTGNASDYLAGDGTWGDLGVLGDVSLKTDFTAYSSVSAITAANIANWNTAYGWGNHASAGYAVASDYYTKTNLQTSGEADVIWDNISSTPTTIGGYGITDAMYSNAPITPGTNTKITYDAKGLVTGGTTLTASDIPNLAWSKITSGTPTTLAGYGITNAYTKTETNALTWGWSSITGTPTTLAGYGITNAYTKTEVNALTWAWSSITSTPTTVSGYGITDAITTAHAANNVIDTGLGTLFLNDAGLYSTLTITGVSDTQVIYMDGTALNGDASFTFDKNTSTTTIGTAVITDATITTLNIYDGSVTLTNVLGEMVFTDSYYSKTLSELVSGATNFWTANGDNIYYYNTGSDLVGINTNAPTAELEVVGHILANNFDSNYFRYQNSNLLLGVNAGDNETGSGYLYIANSNTASPIIKGNFTSSTLWFNADILIQSGRDLMFTTTNVKIYEDNDGELVFMDTVANGGLPINLNNLIDGSINVLANDFDDLPAVQALTASDMLLWGNASILITSGSGTNYLSDDGNYYPAGGGGVTPTDLTWKWDLANVYYRPYADKTEAGGVASDGKFYGGTTNPDDTTRLNYDGNFHATSFYAPSYIGVANVSALAPIHYGDKSPLPANTAEPGIMVCHNYVAGPTTNPHSFVDASTFNRPTYAMASFDCAVEFAGAGSYGHLAAHKAVPMFTGGGTTSVLYNFYSGVNIEAGTTVTTIYNNYVGPATGGTGTVTTNYGYYCYDLNVGTNRWAFYADGTTKSYFGGNIGIANSTVLTSMLTLGTAGTASGTLSLSGSTSGYATITTSAVAGTPTLTLPTSTGTLALTSDIVTPTDDILDWSTNKYTPYAAHPGTTALQLYLGTTNPTGSTRLNLNGALFTYTLETVSNLTINGNIINSVLKTNAGSPAAGYFYTGTTDPTNTTRLNYDGLLYITGLQSISGSGIFASRTTGNTIEGRTTGGYGGNFQATSGTGLFTESNTGRAFYAQQSSSGLASLGSLSYLLRNATMNSGVNITNPIIEIIDNPTVSGGGVNSASVFKATIVSTPRIDLNPRVADGASAIPYLFDTHNNLTTTGAKLLSLCNQGVEKVSATKDGNIYSAGTFAGIYVTDGVTGQSIPTGTTYTKMTHFATNGESSNCTADATNDKITITKTGRYYVNWSLSFSLDTNNINLKATVFLNGTEQNSPHAQRKIGTGADVGAMSGGGFIDVTTAPWDLDLRCRHDVVGTVVVTPIYSNLIAIYVGET